MGFSVGHFEFLFLQDVISMDSVHDFIFGSFYPMVDQRAAFSFVKGFIRKQVIHDAGSGKPERVCQDTVNADMGNGHAVLVTVLLCGTHIRKLQAVTRKFA